MADLDREKMDEALKEEADQETKAAGETGDTERGYRNFR